ncbi:hypothetical protein Agub_g5203 [Astrephomene gubernaculifera]|uniref:Glycosyltransferase family 69 protein n=1 Tax=Astrephomene gubernaculifera TaxID=47775 RepID=A0AAD3HKI6_9CHLO|nr:hypothetical protein Agub_g5203 [Astrephomene gubernaculifera]
MPHRRQTIGRRLLAATFMCGRLPRVAVAVLLCVAIFQVFLIHLWHRFHQSRDLMGELPRLQSAFAVPRAGGYYTMTTATATCERLVSTYDEDNTLAKLFLLARQAGIVVPCHDSALRGLNFSVCSKKCIIAANLHNSMEVIPNMIVQLIWTAHLLGPANILVSIYESGSKDATADWLQLLRAVLGYLSVPHIITTGGITREPGQDRIAYLASVRQAAVDQVLANCNKYATNFCNSSRIVYVNDVLFNAPSMVRLLQYGNEDMACGMDFEPILADHPMSEQRSYMTGHLLQTWHLPRPLASSLASSTLAFRLWKKAYRRSATLLRLLPLSFYDIWVARDVAGDRFTRPAPFTHHGPTAARIQAGLPVSAYCCWNGLIALAAQPLLSRRIAFRAHRPPPHRNGPADDGGGVADRAHNSGGDNECAASECSLLCDDFHRLGRSRIVIDPSVRVAYRAVAAERIFLGSSSTSISSALSSSSSSGGGGDDPRVTAEPADLLPHVEWSPWLISDLEAWRVEQGLPSTVECCGLEPGRDGVDFEHGCVRIPSLAGTVVSVVASRNGGNGSGSDGDRK